MNYNSGFLFLLGYKRGEKSAFCSKLEVKKIGYFLYMDEKP